MIASVLAGKIAILGPFVFPAGVLAYSITFLMTDTVSEFWGKEKANRMVLGGFLTLVVVYGLIQLSLIWPSAPFWNKEQEFAAILESTTRIIIASMIAYLISQFHDVWLFHLLKKRFKHRHLWLRNNISTFLSQTLDTVVFIGVAFYGVMPIFPLIGGQLIVKWGIALIDTPFIYLLVGLIRRLPEDS